MLIINAENLIVGRLASYAAKRALMGEKIAIVNSEKAVITGKRKDILAKYSRKIKMGHPFAGPFVSRMPDRLLRRIIKNMLPHDRTRGRIAFKKVMCYTGIPYEFEAKKLETLNQFNVAKTKSLSHLSIEEISRNLGARF